MIDLSKNKDLLIVELYNYFIFYLPKEAIVNAYEVNGISTEKLYLLEPFFEKVNYIHQNNWYFFNDDPFDISELTFKINDLSKNTLRLFELKESLQEETFEFILKKYMEQLEFHNNIATLLVENYEQHCLSKSKELKEILLLQQIIIREHNTEIINSFKPFQPNATNTNLFQFPDLSSLKGEIIKPDSEIQAFLLNKKPIKKKLTNEDAVAFLLKTVFSKKD